MGAEAPEGSVKEVCPDTELLHVLMVLPAVVVLGWNQPSRLEIWLGLDAVTQVVDLVTYGCPLGSWSFMPYFWAWRQS